MNKIIIPLIALFWVIPASAVTSYLCIAGHSTGFSFDKKNQHWYQAKYNTDEMKYILSRNTEGVWFGKRFGATAINDIVRNSFECPKGFDKEWIECEGITTHFRMNNKSLRYSFVDHSGYVISLTEEEAIKKGIDTLGPYMHIGKCSPF